VKPLQLHSHDRQKCAMATRICFDLPRNISTIRHLVSIYTWTSLIRPSTIHLPCFKRVTTFQFWFFCIIFSVPSSARHRRTSIIGSRRCVHISVVGIHRPIIDAAICKLARGRRYNGNCNCYSRCDLQLPNDYTVQLRPSLNEIISDLIIEKRWTDITYVHDGRDCKLVESKATASHLQRCTMCKIYTKAALNWSKRLKIQACSVDSYTIYTGTGNLCVPKPRHKHADGHKSVMCTGIINRRVSLLTWPTVNVHCYSYVHFIKFHSSRLINFII
jgi:hypothetical protein